MAAAPVSRPALIDSKARRKGNEYRKKHVNQPGTVIVMSQNSASSRQV